MLSWRHTAHYSGVVVAVVVPAVWALGLGAVSPAPPAVELPETLRLTWQAPAQCPDRAVVQEQIARRLPAAGTPTRTVEADATVQAVVRQDAEGYRLELSITTDGLVLTRQIEAADCALLGRATAVVVAISVDATVTTAAVERRMQAQVTSPGEETSALVDDPVDEPATPPSETQPRPADAGAARSSPEIGAALRLAGGLGAGVLPAAGGGLGLSLAAFGDRWRAEVHGSRWFPRSARFDGVDTGARIGAWSAGVRGCFVPSVGSLEIPVCAGPEFAPQLARGFGAPVRLQAQSLWVGAALAGGVVWMPWRWLGLFAGLDSFVSLRRPSYTGPNRPLLFRAAPLAVRATAGVEVRLGGPQRRPRH